VRHAPWYTSLYLKLNDKTRQRDLHRLRELELAFLDTDNALWPGFVVPRNDQAARQAGITVMRPAKA
jgi:hypothetical protein